jgi:hypothetical protein
MSAEHDLNLIAAYVEDRLSAADRGRAAAHLAACADCRAVLAGLLRAGVPDADRQNLRSSWLVRAMSVAALFLIGIGVSLTWYLRGDEIQSPAPKELAAPGSATPDTPTRSPSPGSPATKPPRVQPPTVKRSGGERHIGGKTFRLVAGEWIDAAYDPFALLPVEIVKTPQERARVIDKVPALRAYASLGPRVTVVVNGVVYKLELPD